MAEISGTRRLDLFEKLIQSFDEKDRRALIMYVIGGKPQSEMANELRLPVDCFQRHLERAYNLIKLKPVFKGASHRDINQLVLDLLHREKEREKNKKKDEGVAASQFTAATP